MTSVVLRLKISGIWMKWVTAVQAHEKNCSQRLRQIETVTSVERGSLVTVAVSVSVQENCIPPFSSLRRNSMHILSVTDPLDLLVQPMVQDGCRRRSF